MGDWRPVGSGNDSVYAFLRTIEDESVLVVVNLSHKPVDGIKLTLDASPLQTGAEMAVLLGDSAALAPQIDGNGRFTDYQPLPTLAPHSSLILQLTPPAP